MNRIKLVSIVFIVIFLSNVTSSWAISEDKVESSAEKIVSRWEKLLMKGFNCVWQHELGDEHWIVHRLFPVKGSFAYDIQKKFSVISPYQLIISFESKFGDNMKSPNTNSVSKYTQKKDGFKTAKDALRHTSLKDFKVVDYIGAYSIFYVFQKKSWVYKGGNEYFQALIGDHIEKKENVHYFKKLLKIPVN
jgi:hypothetical protein